MRSRNYWRWIVLLLAISDPIVARTAFDVPGLFSGCDTQPVQSQSSKHFVKTQNDENGRPLSRICFCGEHPDGPSQTWYENGKIKSEGHYKLGKLDGLWTRYYESGELKDQGAWNDGVPEGIWKFYDAKGRLERELDCVEGKCEARSAGTDWWDEFDLSVLALLQNSGGQSYSPQVGWHPGVPLGNQIRAHADLSAALLKNSNTAYPAVSIQGLLGYTTANWEIDLAAGAQTWLIASGGTAPLLGARVSWLTRWRWVRCVYLGYSAFIFPSADLTHELALGVGLRL